MNESAPSDDPSMQKHPNLAPVVNDAKSRTVVGERAPLRRRDFALPVVFVTLAVIWCILRDQYTFAIAYAVAAVGGLLIRLRPATVISTGGIRRPWRPRSVIGWDDVHSVLAPEPGVMVTRIELVTGKTASLEGIPAARSAEVADIGNKPVKPVSRPVIPRPAPARRTDQDVQADIDRRAAALAQEWRRMEAESPRPRSQQSGPHDGKQ